MEDVIPQVCIPNGGSDCEQLPVLIMRPGHEGDITVEIHTDAVVVRLGTQLGLDILVHSTDYRSIGNRNIGNGNIGALLLMTLKDLCLTARNRIESVLGCHCFGIVFVFVSLLRLLLTS
jgi:hypothetical protein